MGAYYDSIADYNADLIAAREAYRADESARAGFCASCHHRPRENHHRECPTCRFRRYAYNAAHAPPTDLPPPPAPRQG